MLFEEFTTPLRILPCDKVLHPVVLKFFIDGQPEVKFRIKDMGDYFLFESTRWNTRYFHHIRKFKTLDEAKNFIFSSELELP